MSLDPKLPLNLNTFFSHLINHPKDANEDVRDLTWAVSIILGIFTVGLVHLGCAIYEHFCNHAEVKTGDNLSEKEQKVDEKAQEILKEGLKEDPQSMWQASSESSTSAEGLLSPVHSARIETTSDIKESFVTFIKELETEIFPYYEQHEQGFDKHSIHGRMHVARAVLFCELMARYFQSKGEAIDFDYVRRTTGLHDAGRKANGYDFWEKQSAEILRAYLVSKGTSNEEAEEKSRIIIKKRCDPNSLAYQIFQSADCLDIMRPCTSNGGREGFKAKFLTFLKEALPGTDDFKFRSELIEEAWLFIQMTEAKKMTDFKESEGFMLRLLKIIESNPDKFKLLSNLL